MTSDRNDALIDFLKVSGWATAERHPLAGDASTRRYERLLLNCKPAILMDAPPKAETPPCPPGATPAEREALGYNALARLAASRVDAFVALATWLRDRGLAAPEVLAFDAEQGFALLEDLGDALFARVLEIDPTPERDLYASAVETLASLHQHQAPSVVARDTAHWPLLSYDAAAMHAESNLLVEWWADRHLDVHLDDEALASWRMAWSSSFTLIQQPKPVLVLRDFHAENTLWRPHDIGVRRVGLIDFQDALAGHPAYDLVSLLEDARRDVSPELAAQMVDHYIAVAAPADNEAFRAGYAVLGAQRNAKIIGIFARLAIRDGKARYLDLIPRVAGHMVRDLQHEVMRPVALWMERYLPGALERAAT